MTERWKYQIKTGLPFGLLMPIAMTMTKWWESSFQEAFFSLRFLSFLIIYVCLGIFGIGYYNWREKLKLDHKKQ